MKVIFITDYVLSNKIGLWDSYINLDSNNDFTYLATAHLEEMHIQMKQHEEVRSYIKYSQELSEEEIQEYIKNADIVVYNTSLDKRVNNNMHLANNIVTLRDHISKGSKFKGWFQKLKFFGIKNSFLAGGKKYLLSTSYHANNDFKPFGYKDRIYRFGTFPVLDYVQEERDEFKILSYGRLEKYKHVEHALYALKVLKKKDSRYHLKIVGEGPEKKKLNRLVKRYKLQDSVEFSSFLTHDEILHEIRTSGIAFYSGDRREGWSVQLNEMLSQKAIVFANTNAGNTLFLANKKNAFIYDSKKLLKKKLLIYFAMDEKERNIVRERAYFTIKNTWNNDVAAQRMNELFVAIVNNENFDKYSIGPVSKYKAIKKKHISDETDLDTIEHKSQKNIALGTLFGWFGFIIGILSGMILIPEITQSMGGDYYGIYTLVSSLISLFLLDFGLQTTTNTYLAKLRAKGDKQEVERFTAIMFKLYLILDLLFVVVITIIYFLVDVIYSDLNGYAQYQRELIKPVLLIVGGYSIINFPTTVFTGVNSAYEKFGFNKFSEFVQKLLYFGLTLLILKLPSFNKESKLFGLVIINACSGIVAILMRAFYMKFYLGISLRLNTKMDKETVKKIFSFSAWALILAICARLVFNITPSIISIMYKKGPDEVTSFGGLIDIYGGSLVQTGVFGIISTIEGYVYTIGAMMSGFFMAKLARTSNNKKDKAVHLQNIAEKVGKLQLVVIGAVILGFITVGQEFIGWWQEDSPEILKNADVIYYGIIALIGYEIIHIPEIIFETAMYTEGHIKPLAIISIVKAAINCGLSFWLTSLYGAFGACLSICAARVVDLVLNNIVYKKYLGISLGKYFGKLYFRGVIALAISLAFGLFMKFYLPTLGVPLAYKGGPFIIVGAGSFIIVYLICTFFITFNLAERVYYKDQILRFLKFGKKKAPVEKGDKVKVLQVVGNMVGGGLEAFVMTYYRKMYEKCEFTFVVFDTSTYVPKEEIESLGGKVIVVPHVKHLFKFNKAFKKILKSEHYDIVHSHLNTLSVFPLRIALLQGYQVRIAHSHATSSSKEFVRNSIKSILKMFAKSYATHYFACSKEAGIYQFGKSAWKNGEITVIKTAIDLNKFAFNPDARKSIREELNISDSTLVVGSFGRVVETKNQKYILNMAKITKEQGKDIKYLFVGSGPLEEELKLIIAKEELDNVIMLPSTPNINCYYSVIDVLALPSLYEGFGLAALEAEANGLYCVLSEFVPSVTLVSGYGKYLPIDNKSINEWVNEISTPHKRGNFYDSLTENGYNIDSNANELLEAYNVK